MDVGNKIKQIRQYKKLTQAELAEGIVTRNMLSAIENSKALPSLTVLKMLADKLQVSCDLLLSDEEIHIDEIVCMEKKIPQMRKLFSSKKYSDVVCLGTDIAFWDNFELKYMMGISYFKLSMDAFFDGNKELFPVYISNAKEYLKKIDLGFFSSYCSFFEGLSEGVFNGKIPSLSDCTNEFRPFVEIIFYIYVINLIERGQSEKASEIYDSVNFTFEPIRYHINSRLAATKYNINRAKELLDELIQKSPSIPEPFMDIIYTELEHYCTLTGDYKKAYECTLHRSKKQI